MLKKMMKQKATMIPHEGFRLVGLDNFEAPGHQLYPISTHVTRAEAEAARDRYVAERINNDDKLFI
jgi:hypothetical protein